MLKCIDLSIYLSIYLNIYLSIYLYQSNKIQQSFVRTICYVHVNFVCRSLRTRYVHVYKRAPNFFRPDYIEYTSCVNQTRLKFKIGDLVRTSKYKYVYPKGFISTGTSEVSVVTEAHNTILQKNII